MLILSKIFVLSCVGFLVYGVVNWETWMMAFGLVLTITSLIIAAVFDALSKRSAIDVSKITQHVSHSPRVYYNDGNTSRDDGGERRPGFQTAKRAG